jgi:hypothetical protein
VWDNGRDDEATVVRAFWPALRDNVVEARVSLGETLHQVAWHSKMLARRAREMESRAARESGAAAAG